MCSDSNGCAINNNYVDDEINDAINDMHGPRNKEVNSNESIGHEIGRNGKNIDYLFSEAHRELYPGCTKFSALSFLVKLMHIKVLNRWSNKSFDMLLELLLDVFPDGANIPKSHYDAKKMLQDFGLGYDSIHACKYDCALFWKENETFHNCPEKRFHEDGVLRHPEDSEVWKDFDNQYPWFAQDARNVRLGLATDVCGIVLVPYNMPPWKCMKESFFMMSLLIPGPHAPGKDIDIYLRPLVDELKELWHDGVHTFDMSSGDYFRMHACLLWTIHDFPAYGNLSGWSTKGWRRSRQHDGKLNIDYHLKHYLGEDILQQLSHVYNSRPESSFGLGDMKIRNELHLQLKGNKLLKPHACYTLTFKKEKNFVTVHLPREAKLAGPVSYRWMYPFERNLGTLKKYVRNKARPEGSIAEAYTVNEALTFCSMYLHGIETCFTRDERNEDNREEQASGHLSIFSQQARPIGGRQLQQLSKEELEKAHWYVINNSTQAHQVFYLDDYKNGQNWKVVQKVQHRHLWDILEVDSNIEVDANFDETNKDDAYQENESCDIEWSFELDDQLERFDRINVNPEVINNNILCMGDRNDDGDDDFICDDIIEEDIIVDNDNIVEEWLSSESESD
ncbi:hypothetical protein AAG906_019710 [Vitis piasezkii]